MAHQPIPGLDPALLNPEPLDQAFTIPSSWYTSPDFHIVDREAVMKPAWHFIGHVSQLPDAGSYLRGLVGDSPAVVVRDHNLKLRAFYNVCRHRGGPLVTDACGTARMLQCQYHGWTYRLDGTLRGVPRFDRVDLFDRRDFGLVPLELATWQGCIFVRENYPGKALEDTLAGIGERIAPWSLNDLHHVHREVYPIACNWKVYVDNYLEGYHVPYVHPELCDVLDVATYDTEIHPTYSLQFSGLNDGEHQYGNSDETAFYYFVFPNFMLNIMPGRVQTNIVQPVSADSCNIIFDYYYSDISSSEASDRIQKDIAFSDHVQQEDIEICLHVQAGLRSDAYDRGRFSVECEAGVHHFQGLLKEAYRGYFQRVSE